MSTRYSRPEGNRVSTWIRRAYLRIRKSFLLSFAIAGLALMLVGGTVMPLVGSPETAGIVGASGLIIFFVNVIGYLVYQFVARRY